MSDIKELYNFLKTLSKTDEPVLPGKVAQVNADDTIDVDVSGVVFFDVRLKANNQVAGKGLRVKPAVGSDVLIAKIGDDKSTEYAVLMYSQVDEHLLEIDTVKLLIDKNGIVLQKGNDTLWSGIKSLIESLEKVVILQGTNIDFTKLALAKAAIKNVLNGS